MLSDRPPYPRPDRWFGKYSGTVIDNRDEQRRGRMRVTVPAVFGSVPAVAPGQPELAPDEGPPVWATPCLPYGHFYIPPVGAKVWVEFEGGHTESPIWVGVWYPAGTVPEPAAISPPDNRVIQTVSGHTVEISDEPGNEHLLIRHKGNGFFSIDQEGNVTIASENGSFLSLSVSGDNLSIVDKNANAITLRKQGTTIVSNGGVALHLSDTDTAHIVAPKIVLEGSSVVLGADAEEPTLLANAFFEHYATHTHGTGVGPSTTPLPPPVLTKFSTSAVAVR